MESRVGLLSDDRARPAVAARRLTTALKQARSQAGLTQGEAADSLDWSLSKIVRIESGSVGISTTDLRALLSLYGIADQARVADLSATAKEARQTPWWKKDYGEIASEQYLQFVEFEQTAAEIVSFQSHFVPGILQTPEYARAILQGVVRAAPARLTRLLAFRLERQKLLASKKPPMMSFVLDENVVRRQVGSADVMSGQISHLVDLAQRPHVSIRILRFTAGVAPGMQTPFVLMRFPDPADSAVLYFEAPRAETLVIENDKEVDSYSRTFDELQHLSLSERDTIEFLKNMAAELE
jgi:transcriptional regulator with XRE-family HTH domain